MSPGRVRGGTVRERGEVAYRGRAVAVPTALAHPEVRLPAGAGNFPGCRALISWAAPAAVSTRPRVVGNLSDEGARPLATILPHFPDRAPPASTLCLP